MQRFEADQVIVAMANYQVPRMPSFARELDANIVQVRYRITTATRRSSSRATHW